MSAISTIRGSRDYPPGFARFSAPVMGLTRERRPYVLFIGALGVNFRICRDEVHRLCALLITTVGLADASTAQAPAPGRPVAQRSWYPYGGRANTRRVRRAYISRCLWDGVSASWAFGVAISRSRPPDRPGRQELPPRRCRRRWPGAGGQ